MFSIHSFLLYTNDGVKYFLMKEFLRKLFFTFAAVIVFVGALSIYNLYWYQTELISEINELRGEITGKHRENEVLEERLNHVTQIYNEMRYIERVVTSVNPSLGSKEIKMWVNSLRDNTDIIFTNFNRYSKLKIASNQSEYSFNPGIALLLSVAAFESDFNMHTRSNKDAYGPMQLRKITAEYIGVVNRENPLDNINGGARFLAGLLNRYSAYPDQLELALASYNAGTGRVLNTWIPIWGERWENIKTGLTTNGKVFKETRNYVNSILAMTYLLVTGEWSVHPPGFWRSYKRYARNYDLAAIYDFNTDPLNF